jgi:hypothetical protein
MATRRDPNELLERTHENLLQFIFTEIELALTFADTAIHADNDDKRNRNAENAYKGYETALAFLQKGKITPDEHNEVRSRIAPLKKALSELGKLDADASQSA